MLFKPLGIAANARASLDPAGRLDGPLDHESGGQRQRIVIGRIALPAVHVRVIE